MSFSLYVHIPYCLSICPYCDFNAYAPKTWPEERYIEALCQEFVTYVNVPPWQGESLETIYFGGGTPSLFQPASLQRFLEVVSDRCHFDQFGQMGQPITEPDITLEADPASVSPETLQGYREIGINRLSLGVQSFEASILKTLGRLHSGEEALHAIELARGAAFSNLNIDLIFGVPGQTLALLERDLEQVFACSPEHISIYGLTYEQNTPFYAMRQKGVLQPIDEEAEVAMYTRIRTACAAHGYEHYEISNFAQPGYASQHNTRYWQGGNYLGLGAGAHSFACTPGWGKRWSNIRNPKKYMDAALSGGHTNDYTEQLTKEQASGEYIFLNLRQLAGMSLSGFEQRFGQNFCEQFPHVADLIAEGLIEQVSEPEKVKLTPQGLLVADSIFETFF